MAGGDKEQTVPKVVVKLAVATYTYLKVSIVLIKRTINRIAILISHNFIRALIMQII